MDTIELWESEIAEKAERDKILKEEAIYNFYDTSSISESSEVIHEYTQKQLLDPGFLKKLKDNRLKFDSITGYISAIIGVISAGLTIVIGGVTGGPFGVIGGATISPFIGMGIGLKLQDAFSSLSAKVYAKNEAKYKKQFAELKAKAQKAIEKDGKNASKYKEIINQIDKIEKMKAAEAAKIEKEAAAANLDYTIESYKAAIDILNGKITFKNFDERSSKYFDALYILDEYLKVPENIVFDKLTKDCTIDTAGDIFGGSEEAHVRGFKSSTKVIRLNLNPDEEWLVDLDKKKIVLVDYKRSDFMNLYDSYKYYGGDYEIDESIEEADKYLGYYNIAECPKAVDKKSMPK